METVKPLTWEEAKDQVAKKHGWTNWDNLNEAAELYASSRVRALEEELATIKRNAELVAAYQKAEWYKTDEFEKLASENKRLQERLDAADACIQVWSWHADLNMTILEWRDACRTRLEKYNFLKP